RSVPVVLLRPLLVELALLLLRQLETQAPGLLEGHLAVDRPLEEVRVHRRGHRLIAPAGEREKVRAGDRLPVHPRQHLVSLHHRSCHRRGAEHEEEPPAAHRHLLCRRASSVAASSVGATVYLTVTSERNCWPPDGYSTLLVFRLNWYSPLTSAIRPPASPMPA